MLELLLFQTIILKDKGIEKEGGKEWKRRALESRILDSPLYKTLSHFFIDFQHLKNYTTTHPIENAINIKKNTYFVNKILTQIPKIKKTATTQLVCKESEIEIEQTSVNPNCLWTLRDASWLINDQLGIFHNLNQFMQIIETTNKEKSSIKFCDFLQQSNQK
jgi:hypothetical protein